jgi:hypothetical protein
MKPLKESILHELIMDIRTFYISQFSEYLKIYETKIDEDIFL